MNRWNNLASGFILVSLLLIGCATERKFVGNIFQSSSPQLNVTIDPSFKYLGQTKNEGTRKSYDNTRDNLFEEEYHVFIPRDASQSLDHLLLILISKTETHYIDTESDNINNIDLGIAKLMGGDTYQYFSRVFSPSNTWQLKKFVEKSGYQIPKCLVSRCFQSYPQENTRVNICYYEDPTPAEMTCKAKYNKDNLGTHQKGFLQDLHERALAAIGAGSSEPYGRLIAGKWNALGAVPAAKPKDSTVKEKVTEKRKTTENDIKSLIQSGMDAEKAGRLDDAIIIFTEALKLTPQSSVVYYKRASVYHRQKQYLAAMKDYDQAIYLQEINLDPSIPTTYRSRGRTWSASGDLTKAIEDYSKAIELDPTYTLAYMNRAEAYKLINIEAALQDYGKVIASDPSNTEALKNYTKILLEKGKEAGKAGEMDMAIRVFTEIMRVAPNNAAAYYHRGIALFNKEKFKQALQDFTETIRLNSVDDLAYLERGVCYYQLDNFQKAIEDFSAAIALKPDNPRAYRSRGAAFFGKGDYGSAIRDFDTAISLDPKSPLAYVNRAEAYRKAGRFEDVVGDYDKALQISPDDPEILYKRGLAYWSIKKRSMALTDLRKAANLGFKEARDFLAKQNIR